jgi:hypothetical protein
MKYLLPLCFCSMSLAQDLDALLDAQDNSSEAVYATFKSNRTTLTQSVEGTGPGTLNFAIAHRFAPITQTGSLGGLDGAHTRLGLDVGLGPKWNIGIERTNDGLHKPLSIWSKTRLWTQTVSGSIPLTSALYLHLSQDLAPGAGAWDSRTSGVAQWMFARKFNSFVSLQLSPEWSWQAQGLEHKNTSTPGLGAATRIKWNHRMAWTAEAHFPWQPSPQQKPIWATGLDLETGGHVFQLHITNAHSLADDRIWSENSSWSPRLGFQITRAYAL